MILTVTMNPSVDISYKIDKHQVSQVMRCDNYSKTAGGKGLNVARVARQMEHKVIATGVLGGTLGMFIQQQLTEQGIQHDFSKINAETRNCIAILDNEQTQTEILETGPFITAEELLIFKEKFASLITHVTVVTISGSLPPGISADVYPNLIALAQEQGVPVIIDTSGNTLKTVLLSPFKPFAIKPNIDELQGLTGIEISSNSVEQVEQLEGILRGDLFEGIPLIVVSRGAEGAFVKYHEKFYQVTIPKIKVVNPVGSGDSTVAGLGIALDAELDFETMIKTSMTLGMLNAMEEKTGCVNPAMFETYYNSVKIVEINN